LVFDKALQGARQVAGAFGSAHHAQIERWKDVGLLCHHHRQALTVTQPIEQARQYRAHGRAAFLVEQAFQRLHDAQAGLQQGQQLLAEKHQGQRRPVAALARQKSSHAACLRAHFGDEQTALLHLLAQIGLVHGIHDQIRDAPLGRERSDAEFHSGIRFSC